MWDPAIDFTCTVLKNGLTVYAANWTDRPWQTAQVVVHAGSESDPYGLEGLAHFLEHVLNNNAPLVHREFETLIDGCGGIGEYGMTSIGWSQYGWAVPTTQFTELLYHFGTMLVQADIEKGIEKERAVILQEFNESYSLQKRYDLRIQRHCALYPDMHLSRSPGPIGTRQAIERINRANLESFYRTHYTPANMSFVTLGGIDTHTVIDLIESSPFGSMKPGARTPRAERDEIQILPHENRVEVCGSEYPGLMRGTKPEYDSYARIPGILEPEHLSVFATMLENVLTHELRTQRQWTYDVSTDVTGFGRCNQFSIHCGSFDERSIGEFERVVNDCIALLVSQSDLFDATVRSHVARLHMSDLSGFRACKNAAIMIAHDGRMGFIEDRIRTIQSMTMVDVRRLVSLLAPERRWTRITRP